ncbi:flagellar biosynthetic protein FliO [Pseudotabrizicola algicola]|uniref:flagellar biosynthetic protein FliO n=1 Tax=Pseudotabrizicola algicola TaxID=2709381 RepID=UPI001F0738B5|nr:flagellar biosynthetic protein FliO [Pseudotabrizicola algicola]
MDLLRVDQIIILSAFLAGLGLLWALVLRNRQELNDHFGRGRRLRVLETAALGPADRAVILTVDGQDFLLLKLKGANPVLKPLRSARSECGGICQAVDAGCDGMCLPPEVRK